jgi:ElaB/YqjD/DUF883 family membrane-anchored ribosome-binding protein
MRPGDFARVLAWLTAAREREADRLAKADEALQETRARIIEDAEARAAQFERIKRETPWKLD